MAEVCVKDYLEPLCSSEVHSAVKRSTDYVLAEIGSSSEDVMRTRMIFRITVTTTRSERRATRYLL